MSHLAYFESQQEKLGAQIRDQQVAQQKATKEQDAAIEAAVLSRLVVSRVFSFIFDRKISTLHRQNREYYVPTTTSQTCTPQAHRRQRVSVAFYNSCVSGEGRHIIRRGQGDRRLVIASHRVEVQSEGILHCNRCHMVLFSSTTIVSI